MSYAAEAAWIRGRLDTGWKVAGVYRTPVVWDNTSHVGELQEPYIRPSIQHSGADQASLGGSPLHRYDGMLIVEILAPQHTGSGVAEELSDVVADLFRSAKGGGITFRTPYPINVGPTDDGGWYKVDVLCAFERDTIHA